MPKLSNSDENERNMRDMQTIYADMEGRVGHIILKKLS